MTKEYIEKTARELANRYATRNPAEIAEAMDIGVTYKDIGSLEGMYVYIEGNPFIVVNTRLDEPTADAIIAHELGHHALHGALVQTDGVRKTMLCDVSIGPEYEANLFAALLLIDQKELIDLLQEGSTVGQAAAQLSVPPVLVQLLLQKY